MSTKQKVKQIQKVVVNVNAPSKKKKKKRVKRTSELTSEGSKYIKYPNSIGYALNNQLYQIPQPKILDYNLALAQSNILREQQMKTGSLIPNQQINTLTTTNPITQVSTNTQANMLDPTEGLVEEVVEYETTDAYNPVIDRLVNKVKDLEASEEILLKQMEADLSGVRSKLDNFALGERASQAIAQTLVKPVKIGEEIKAKAFNQTIKDLNTPIAVADSFNDYFERPLLKGEPFDIIPKPKTKRGRKPGSKNKPKTLGEREDIVIPSTPFEL